MVTLPIRRGLRNGCGIADRFMTTKQCWSRTFRHRTEGAADSRLTLRTSSPIRSERNSATIRSFIPTVVLTDGFRRRQPIPCLPAVLVVRRLLDIRPATEIYSGRRTRVSLNLSTTTAFWVRAISTCWAAECFANRAITTGRTVITTTTTTIITRRHLRPTTTFGRISNSIRSNSRLHSSWAISDRNSHRPSIRPATTITTCPVIRPLSSTTTSFPTFETLPTSIKTTATDQDDVLGRKTIDDATLCLPVVLLSSFYSLSPHFVDNSSVLFRKWVDVYKHSTTIVARLATDLRPHHPSLSVSSSSCSIQQNNNNPALAVLGAAISLWSSLLFQLDRFPSSHLHRAYHEKQINKIQIKVIIIIAGLLFYFFFLEQYLYDLFFSLFSDFLFRIFNGSDCRQPDFD